MNNGFWLVEVGFDNEHGERECAAEVVNFSAKSVALAAANMMRGKTLADLRRWANTEEWPHNLPETAPVAGVSVVYYDGEQTNYDDYTHIDF